jgi:protein-L-isoaspartate(D-aspartate) O-methyltransferase
MNLYDVGGEHPIPSSGQLPLDDPRDHALQLEVLAPWVVPGASVLDCGSGSGYLTAALAVMAAGRSSSGGSVVAVERKTPLQEASVNRIAKALQRICTPSAVVDPCILSRITILPADGADAHFLPCAPFNVIRVGFALPAAECVEADNLLRQLKRGGRMIAHVQGDPRLHIFDKDKDGRVLVTRSARASVRQPPLVVRRVEMGQENATLQHAEAARVVERDQIYAKLKTWRAEFERRTGRKPNRHDMASDSNASLLFTRFSELNKIDI